MSVTRRELCSMVAMLSASFLPATALDAVSMQDSSSPLLSAVYPFDQLPVKVSPTKVETRAILKGKLATGESVEEHETTLPPGGAPHPPHHHEHTEMWLDPRRHGRVQGQWNEPSRWPWFACFCCVER